MEVSKRFLSKIVHTGYKVIGSAQLAMRPGLMDEDRFKKLRKNVNALTLKIQEIEELLKREGKANKK